MRLIKKAFLINLLIFSLYLVFPPKLSAFTCASNGAKITGNANQITISVQLNGTLDPNDTYSLEYVAGPGIDIIASGASASGGSVVFIVSADDIKRIIDSGNKKNILFKVHSTLKDTCNFSLHIDEIKKAYEDATGIILPATGVGVTAPPPATCTPESGFGDANTGVPTGLGCIPTQPDNLVRWILKYAILMGGGIAFLLSVWGGITILLAAGNPEKINEGKEIIGSAITGLMFIILSVFLLRLIGFDILKLPGFTP